MKGSFFVIIVMWGMLLTLNSFASEALVWVDVRSVIEHKIDSIDGDMRISHSDIVDKANALFPNKATKIRLYCRSGGRAGKAQVVLQKAGYQDVVNMGSIDDARKVRGLSH